MTKNEIITLLNKTMAESNVPFILDEKTMDIIILDASRAIDDRITDSVNMLKSKQHINVTSAQKEEIRKSFLGYKIANLPDYVAAYKPDISDADYEKAYSLINEGFNRNASVMVQSLIARVKRNFLNEYEDANDLYLDYIQELQKGKNQLLIITVDADMHYSVDNIAEIIESEYDNLSNFHHAIIIFRDGKTETTSWSTIAKTALFMEQFKVEHSFNAFEKKNKERRISELKAFVDSNDHITPNDNLYSLIENFYDGVCYGFNFEDLFISSDGKEKTLVMQKVQLDEEPKKCPACLQSIVRGNSYPRMLYKSFECQNPGCPARSKIGRGKRYDLHSAKRQIMLERNSNLDHIDDRIYTTFRRDILTAPLVSINDLILLYSWDGDNVLIVNDDFKKKEYQGRGIKSLKYNKFTNKKEFETIRFYKLFKALENDINLTDMYNLNNKANVGKALILNGNSTDLIYNIDSITKIKSLGGAVTSPPYYNAREYSQWTNLLCYLIDMMVSAKSVYYRLDDTGTYIYNIGDVVGQDNIYIISNMSNRRQMLGFYSIVIFELAGFKTTGNIIWDKGEVQSKRNSTPNHVSGYVKPVNAYEHCFVFTKNKRPLLSTEIQKIETVKKINSKGENILGHTAPYPTDIAKLIIPFVDKGKYIVDPFLGSGTTAIAMNEEGRKSVGCELDENYYNLAVKRIQESEDAPAQIEFSLF